MTNWKDTVDNIISKADGMFSESPPVYSIPMQFGRLLYRQHTSNGEWINSCQYLAISNQIVMPNLWTLSEPDIVWQKFFEHESTTTFAKFSRREFKKLRTRPKKLLNTDDITWYQDSNGDIYLYQSNGQSQKSRIAEWEKFHDKPDAVFGVIKSGPHHNTMVAWYESEDEFNGAVAKAKESTPSYAQTVEYYIKRRGYPSIHPDDIKQYIRLPSYPIKQMVNELGKYDAIQSWQDYICRIPYFEEVKYSSIFYSYLLAVLNKILEVDTDGA